MLNAFLEEVAKRELKNVTVSPDGVHRRVPAGAHCGGVRARPGEGHLRKDDPDKVASIVSEHLVNGRVVTEYTIGAAE